MKLRAHNYAPDSDMLTFNIDHGDHSIEITVSRDEEDNVHVNVTENTHDHGASYILGQEGSL